MKHLVDQIICSFTKDEYREFRYFLSRRDNKPELRNAMLLLESIRKGEISDVKNDNAAHQVRKRLKRQLEQFTALENIRQDDASKIHNIVETAKYLFRKNLYKQAWDYLLKAEQLAEQAEEYQLLDYILDIQLSYSYNIAVPPPEDFFVPNLLKKRQKNRLLESIDSNTNAAYAQLIYEIREKFSKQLSVNVEELAEKIFKDYALDSAIYQHNLRIYCKLVNVSCRILREKKDYEGLKNYAINSYETLRIKEALDKIPIDFLTDLLDTTSVASIWCKDYTNYEKYINLYALQVKKLQAGSSMTTYYDFVPAVDAADLYMCTNRLAKAREILGPAQVKYASHTQSARIFCLLRMSLIAMHFKYGEYDSCIRYYQELIAYDEKKILNERGFRLEILLFTRIYGVLFYYESGDDYYAAYLLTQVKRRYAQILKMPESKRECTFLNILENILRKPLYLKSRKFRSDSEQFIQLKEFHPGDWEYISLNAWLQSRQTGMSYYECFLEQSQTNK